jgi:hypothetical protein
MSVLWNLCRLLVIAAGMSFAAGCSGARPAPPTSSNFLPQSSAFGRPAQSSAWAKSVFVSDHFVSKVYQFADAANGRVLGVITDAAGPAGLDMDAKGNLYVAAEGDYGIKVYAPGTYSAKETLSDPGEFISSVAVCPNGTVYAANEFAFNQKPGDVAIYAPGATSPTGTIPDANIYSAAFVACDGHNVVWFTYQNSGNQMQVASYDGKAVSEYGNESLGPADSASGIRALPGDGLAIGNTSVGINFYHDPPRKSDPGRPLNCRVGSAITFSFDRNDEHIYEVDSSEYVEKCDRSGKEAYTIGQGTLDTAADVFTYPAGNS